MKRHEAVAFRKHIDDYEASCHEWEEGVEVTAQKSTVMRFGFMYVCIQSHTTAANFAPELAPALWTRIRKDWEPWEQPLGSTDAYRTGAKVTYNGARWVNESDYNVYAPGVYGWTEAV